MNVTRTALLVAIAATVLIGTGVAAGAVAADAPGTNAIDDSTVGAASDDAGPPDDLPAPVPEFVGDLYDAIDGFLSGVVDDVGDTVSGIAGGAGVIA